ncbi:MAG: DUF1919 domain-containing protein [Roseburia sp.]|nr:DUF1919 domain-containing protein [Roseburia sp.]
MNTKETIKYLLSEKNPVAAHRRKQMRSRLVNTGATFLCPNCIGGILFHDLGLRFQSPTVNLMMTQTDFAKFVLNMDQYLNRELEFFKHPEYTCPCAHLGDLTIHFTHYHTQEEAERKWKERTERINRENLFVFLMERDGLTEKEMRQLGAIYARGLVIFTANNYSNIYYTVQIKKYCRDGEVGNILTQSYWNDGREYERYFDFVRWFNEADGKPFDVSKFVRSGARRK